MKSYEKRIPFRDVLVKNSEVLRYVTADELDSALDPERYTGTAVQQVDLVLRNMGYIHKI